MKYDILILSVSFLLMGLNLLTFYFKLRKNSDLFYLVSICSIVWSFIFGFLYGFPLDEGVVPENQIALYERGRAVVFGLFLLNAVLLSLMILKYYRIKR
ncbi:hypothetical protein [Fluviicola taffensis]|uniref:Uncharacterized protein n=1 Tax=Fluviicola taffensis (strain DSM 16823 / NCIMB 13979 / RW262) TaxID=755732 RepID=F2I9D9_FLUTR|nr:hypothetical protein [Fluviicola taffensis]AEA44096.1 hypothetical protein Fluta_2110 [Fluviicola taffensis DSM 16823]